MSTGHIVQAYDADLNELETLILKMGKLANIQLELAINSLTSHDVKTAKTVVDSDKIMDKLELDVAAHSAEIFALRQPVAADLRSIIAALKISNDLERIGDHAKNIAKRTIKLQKMPLISRFEKTIRHIFMKVQEMMEAVLISYVKRDAEQALIILKKDEEIDRLYSEFLREIIDYMVKDTGHIPACTHLLFIAKNAERMGDHVGNIAEQVYYIKTGDFI